MALEGPLPSPHAVDAAKRLLRKAGYAVVPPDRWKRCAAQEMIDSLVIQQFRGCDDLESFLQSRREHLSRLIGIEMLKGKALVESSTDDGPRQRTVRLTATVLMPPGDL